MGFRETVKKRIIRERKGKVENRLLQQLVVFYDWWMGVKKFLLHLPLCEENLSYELMVSN
jgi:hypothetical protein